MVDLKEIAEAVIKGNRKKVQELVSKALEDGLSPEEIINNGLLAGMSVVGERFKNNEIFVPEVLVSARAMQAGMDILKPLIAKNPGIIKGKVVIGTVKGDLHDIGKNLVAMMLEGAGYQVFDLGIDVPPEKFVEAIKEYNPDIVGMSALLTTTMPQMGVTIEVLKKEGVRDKVKVIVGGAPVTETFAKEIGADGYAPDAPSAVELVNQLLGLK
ncbi:cobalamin B12-binding domain-containing protein [Dictyoglomus thermophilum]|uniref:Trimethylamine corrinoid protein 2 n=2 Tax=Dictyoglomus thermophilum TaxID=14 RepID=B5YD39_DICT6|nr:corrinoid protein [Dictyoglomus thermophilum]ACI19047.1 trimethylamine corrinoid protein 2 [Dictyoglomus thermophilum H-6-12]MCX7720303.1 corrinoid protein [Dictyoglomus thermophilum]TYT23238.1 cobalamin-binding protein [Dictyoglomus thermophilum]